MSTFLLRALIGAATLFAIGAGAHAADCDSPVTAGEALKAEDARYVVQVNQDYDAMQRIFADDLVYIHSSAAVDNKASYIERQRAGLHYLSLKRDNENVRVFGCLAIITGAATVKVSQNNADRTVRLMFHSIWAKRGSDLRFVSWESTSIPANP